MTELLRFLAVTLLGVMLDLAIAMTLHTGLGVSLWIAAAIGFTLAASANYVIHQTWSFRTGPRSLSARRAMQYSGVALATLAVRIAIVAALDHALGGDPPLLILICGAGGSFFVNFTMSKHLVFADSPAPWDLS
ncbi:MAG: GtrA family protein [Parerythrobacter sp.]